MSAFQITLCADSAIDLARQVYDLNAQLNPGEVNAAEAAPAAPAGRATRARRAAVDTAARPGPSDEAPAAAAPAADAGIAGAVGQSEGGAAAEAADEGGNPAAEAPQEEVAAPAAGEPEVQTSETCNELARQLAERVSFSAVQDVFKVFDIKKFKELPAEKYADFCSEVRGRLEAKAA